MKDEMYGVNRSDQFEGHIRKTKGEIQIASKYQNFRKLEHMCTADGSRDRHSYTGEQSGST